MKKVYAMTVKSMFALFCAFLMMTGTLTAMKADAVDAASGESFIAKNIPLFALYRNPASLPISKGKESASVFLGAGYSQMYMFNASDIRGGIGGSYALPNEKGALSLGATLETFGAVSRVKANLAYSVGIGDALQLGVRYMLSMINVGSVTAFGGTSDAMRREDNYLSFGVIYKVSEMIRVGIYGENVYLGTLGAGEVPTEAYAIRAGGDFDLAGLPLIGAVNIACAGAYHDGEGVDVSLAVTKSIIPALTFTTSLALLNAGSGVDLSLGVLYEKGGLRFGYAYTLSLTALIPFGSHVVSLGYQF